MHIQNALRPMPELTMIATQFAEAALIVRTLLLLLSALSWLLRVPIDTVRVHLVTHSIFLEELTDGHLLLDGVRLCV